MEVAGLAAGDAALELCHWMWVAQPFGTRLPGWEREALGSAQPGIDPGCEFDPPSIETTLPCFKLYTVVFI